MSDPRSKEQTLQILSDLLERPDYSLDIPCKLSFKERPRMTKTGHAYMSTPYKNARLAFRDELQRQWDGRPMLSGPLAVYVLAFGEPRGDGDNLVGFMMDAAGPLRTQKLPGILWSDDRVSVLPILLVDWKEAKAEEERWLINLLRLDRYPR